jgi:uncharacterized protein (DUF1697 family)
MNNRFMIDYYAFLRGINVGGKNSVKMENLRQIFADCGFSNVQSYIQSGNILFRYKPAELPELTKKIETKIKKAIGNEVPLFLRTREQLEKIVKLDPFKGTASKENTKHYVSFLSKHPTVNLTLPIISEKDGLEFLSIIDSDAFLLSFEIKGRYGYPNNFIEKKLKVTASSRYWNTVLKMMDSVSGKQ